MLNHKLVIGQILIQGGDDPVAVFPHLARGIDRVAVGIGVTRRVEPRPGPAFAIMRGGKQTLDQASVGLGVGVVEKKFRLPERGWKTGEIEADPAEECSAISGGGWREVFRGESGEDEGIDGINRASGLGYWGNDRPDGRDVGPVFAPSCALGDPAAQKVFLGGGERIIGISRRHDLLGVVTKNPGDEFAVVGAAGDDRDKTGFAPGEGFDAAVQPQARFTGGGIGTVAGVALVRENGLNLATKINGLRAGGGRKNKGAAKSKNEVRRAIGRHKKITHRPPSERSAVWCFR